MTIQQFVDFVRQECADLDVQFVICEDEGVQLTEGEMKCNGFFSEEPIPTLAIATGKPVDQWFPVLVHEYCHMMQWNDESPLWLAGNLQGVDTTSLIDLWLAKKIELLPEQIQDVFYPTMAVEHDCERRALGVIAHMGLPIDLGLYAQRANAYVLFHHKIMESRRWYTIGSEPYNIPEIYQNMPTRLVPDFKVITPEQSQLLDIALSHSTR